jgi:hypothetical protein
MPETKLPPVEAEAQATMDLFRDAVNGTGTIAHALEEIENDRRTYGIGSEKEKLYTERVRAKLYKEDLIPEVSLIYGKEKISDMAENSDRAKDPADLRVTDKSMKEFRVAEYKQMTDVEKAMNHYLMKKSDDLKSEGLMCGGMFGSGKYFTKDDLDAVFEKERGTRTENIGNRQQASSIISALAANDSKLLKQLTDSSVNGITKEWIEWEEELDNANNKRLSGSERKATHELSQVFDDIARGDDVISLIDLKYWGAKNGADTSALKRK